MSMWAPMEPGLGRQPDDGIPAAGPGAGAPEPAEGFGVGGEEPDTAEDGGPEAPVREDGDPPFRTPQPGDAARPPEG